MMENLVSVTQNRVSNLEVCSTLFLLFLFQTNNALVPVANVLFQETFSKGLKTKINKP